MKTNTQNSKGVSINRSIGHSEYRIISVTFWTRMLHYLFNFVTQLVKLLKNKNLIFEWGFFVHKISSLSLTI